MKKDDDFDLGRVLEGFNPGHGIAADEDPTRVLDGWRPGAAPRRHVPRQAEDARVVELPRAGRLRERPHGDVPHLDLPRAPSPPRPIDVADVGRSASRAAVRHLDLVDVDTGWQPSPAVAVRKPGIPGVLAAWRPGAWVGAIRRVFRATAEVVETPNGPVVETFPPHVLVALWPPEPEGPFVGRWPKSVQLAAVEPDEAAALLMPQLPPEAELWLTEHDGLDWAALGELVLLHDTTLRDFQLKALRTFVDEQRDTAFRRLNDDYQRPDGGGPVQRKPPAA